MVASLFRNWKKCIEVLVQHSLNKRSELLKWTRAHYLNNLGLIHWSSQGSYSPKPLALLSPRMDQPLAKSIPGETSISSKFHSNSTESAATSSVEKDSSEDKDRITILHAIQIFDTAVDSVLPHKMVKRHLSFDRDSDVLTVEGKSYHLHQNVYIVGFGKAVLGMAKAVEDLIGEHIVRGALSVPFGAKSALRESGKVDMIPGPNSKVKVREGAANNLPDEEAHKAAKEIGDIAKSVGDEDVLLVLISGGGSALLPFPHGSIGMTDITQVTREMAKAGANIKQLNYMRKQLEVLKGGGLATLAFPAQVLALILSDVIGDPLDFIASGPTVPDTSTPEGCLSIFSQLKICDVVPQSVTDFLTLSNSSNQKDSTEGQEMVWTKVQNVVIGSNALACESAAVMSKELGYCPLILSTEIEGEARDIGKGFALLAKYICLQSNPSMTLGETDLSITASELAHFLSLESNRLDEVANLIKTCKDEKKNVAIIAGGETTVTVRGSGKGGRNQEMALSAALELNNQFSTVLNSTEEQKDSIVHTQGEDTIRSSRPFSLAFLSGGTDGQDGPTPSAGGVVTLDFVNHANQSGFDPQQYLSNNDSYSLLKAVNEKGYLLKPGLTGTNVMDVQLLLPWLKRTDNRTEKSKQCLIDISTAQICPFDSDGLEYDFTLHYAIYHQAKAQMPHKYGLTLDLNSVGVL